MKALDMMKPVKTRSLENVKITDKVDPNFRNYDEVRKALGVPVIKFSIVQFSGSLPQLAI